MAHVSMIIPVLVNVTHSIKSGCGWFCNLLTLISLVWFPFMSVTVVIETPVWRKNMNILHELVPSCHWSFMMLDQGSTFSWMQYTKWEYSRCLHASCCIYFAKILILRYLWKLWGQGSVSFQMINCPDIYWTSRFFYCHSTKQGCALKCSYSPF